MHFLVGDDCVDSLTFCNPNKAEKRAFRSKVPGSERVAPRRADGRLHDVHFLVGDECVVSHTFCRPNKAEKRAFRSKVPGRNRRKVPELGESELQDRAAGKREGCQATTS